MYKVGDANIGKNGVEHYIQKNTIAKVVEVNKNFNKYVLLGFNCDEELIYQSVYENCVLPKEVSESELYRALYGDIK